MNRPVHFEIHGADPQKLADFYTSLFGWKISRWGDQPYWMVETGDASAPGINGGIVQRRGAPPVEGQAVNSYVCTVDVEDLDATVNKATTSGGTLALPRMPIPGVGWLAYVKDPDGNLLGLMQSDTSAA